jgi:hypothetical protein
LVSTAGYTDTELTPKSFYSPINIHDHRSAKCFKQYLKLCLRSTL